MSDETLADVKVNDIFTATPENKWRASETEFGVTRYANERQVQAGNTNIRAVTPAGLHARTATATRTGLVELATDAEARRGTDTERAVTPAGLKAALANIPTATIAAATEAEAGKVELATAEETKTGTDTERAVTPAGLKAALPGAATEEATGTVQLATAAEVATGTDTAKAITPAGLASRTATEDRAGLIERATVDEAETGTDTTLAVTPAGLTAAINQRAVTQAVLNTSIVNTLDELATAIGNSADTSLAITIGQILGSKAAITDLPGAASTTEAGTVELATVDEAKTGTDMVKAVTPEGLAAAIAAAIATLVGDAPDALNTLGELATRLTTIAAALATKAGSDQLPGAATDAAAGTVELATTDEATTGTDTARAVTPAGLAAATAALNTTITTALGAKADADQLPGAASEAAAGTVELATTTEAEAGTDTARAVTPAGLAAAIAAIPVTVATQETQGVVELATVAEAKMGTDTARAVTPAGLEGAITELVGTAPTALNTLGKIGDALGDDAKFATTMQTALGLKADKTELVDATEGAKGMVELATVMETKTGTDATKAVTPAGLKAAIRTIPNLTVSTSLVIPVK